MIYQMTLGVPNPGLPVRVTLAWSDAAGAVGANPALVNNLDLTVVDGANTYLGNRFTAGTSATGGTPDTRNNLENVFIQTSSRQHRHHGRGHRHQRRRRALQRRHDGPGLRPGLLQLRPEPGLHPRRHAAQRRRLRSGQRRLHGERRLDPELHRSGDPLGERQPGGHHGRLQHQPGDPGRHEHADHLEHRRGGGRLLHDPGRRRPAPPGPSPGTVGLDLFNATPSAVEPADARQRRGQPAGAAHLHLAGGQPRAAPIRSKWRATPPSPASSRRRAASPAPPTP